MAAGDKDRGFPEALWAPWRMAYMETASRAPDAECLFCDLPRVGDDRETLIVHRGGLVFVMLNKYPYNSGHLMIAPFRHVPRIADLTADERLAVMDTLALAEASLAAAFHPHGFNVGANIGEVAGAGVPGHIHFHVVPRWQGDTNFMPVLGGTKVMGEYLLETYDKLRKHWRN